MRRTWCAVALVLVLAPAVFLQSPAAAAEPHTDAAVAAGYVDGVVIPTYTLLSQRLPTLGSAIATLRQAPTEPNLQLARQAWRAARQPWERSESFLFGPVSNRGFDPALDTWPTSSDNLAALLTGDMTLDGAVVAALEPDIKGYHALEMILYGEQARKTAAELTPRELLYAELVASEMTDISQTLLQAWTQGVDGEPPFRTILTSAGPDNSVYGSPEAVTAEIVNGISGILNEVAEEKIGRPLDDRDPSEAESRFSQTSIEDYKDNVRGALHAYTGALPGGTGGTSVQMLVQARDPMLDGEITSGFQRVLTALEAIPTPFELSVTNTASSAAARATRNTTADLAELFDHDVFALLVGEHETVGLLPGESLADLATLIDDANEALAAGNVEAAVDSWSQFDEGWGEIEDGVRDRSRDRYREIEISISEVRATLARPVQPDPAAAGAALTKLRQLINTALPELQ